MVIIGNNDRQKRFLLCMHACMQLYRMIIDTICGVCFQIWQNKEPTGKPIPGSSNWTALSGNHKLLLLKKLPAKMGTIVKEDLSPRVAKLWNVG
jgi:hypothetical protein